MLQTSSFYRGRCLESLPALRRQRCRQNETTHMAAPCPGRLRKTIGKLHRAWHSSNRSRVEDAHLSRASLRYAMSVLPHRYGQAQTCPCLLGAPELSLVTSDFHLGGRRPCKLCQLAQSPAGHLLQNCRHEKARFSIFKTHICAQGVMQA